MAVVAACNVYTLSRRYLVPIREMGETGRGFMWNAAKFLTPYPEKGRRIASYNTDGDVSHCGVNADLISCPSTPPIDPFN